MPRFTDVDVFLAVADAASFRRAAHSLGLTKSTVSRAIQRLEQHLGVDLLVRDQQAHRLTEAGLAYRRHALGAAAALAEAERAVAAVSGTVQGSLRIAAPHALGQACLTRMCADFLALHPDVDIELRLSDTHTRVSSERVDLVIRASPSLPDSDLRVRRLGGSPLLAVASPQAAARVDEGLVLVRFALPDGTLLPVPTPPTPATTRLVVDDYLALRSAALASAGVAVLPECFVARELHEGLLVRVLPAWRLPVASYWGLFAAQEGVPQKLRLLIDHLAAAFADWTGSGSAAP